LRQPKSKFIKTVTPDTSIRAYLDDLLRYFGHRTDWACSARVVATPLEGNQYDTLLLDENMNFSKVLFLHWLRERIGLRAILIRNPYWWTRSRRCADHPETSFGISAQAHP
jgi:CheY-like chemotaxis protein